MQIIVHAHNYINLTIIFLFTNNSMDQKIISNYEKYFIPFYKKKIINYPKVSFKQKKLEIVDIPDTHNWIDNGFDPELYQKLFKTSGDSLFYMISNLVDIFTNLNKYKYNQFKTHIDYPYFCNNDDLIIKLKLFIYYIIDLFPISTMCVVSSVALNKDSENIDYYVNIKIKHINPINIHFNNIYKNKLFDLIYFNSDVPLNNRWGIPEYTNHQGMLRTIIYVFQTLKENGTFILEIFDIFSNLSIEFITLLSGSFDEISIIKLPFHIMSNTKYIIFHNFKNNISQNQLKTLIGIAQKWEKADPSIGHLLNIKNRDISHVYSNLKNFENDENSNFINTINVTINNTIKKFIKDNTLIIIKDIINYIDFIDSIIAHYALNKLYLQNIIKLNCNYSLYFMKTYSIDFKLNKQVKRLLTLKITNNYLPLYNINKDFTNINDVLIDHSKYIITSEGEYSVSHPVSANIISNLVLSKFGPDNIILDGTGNMGGNTISFARKFKKVISMEIEEDNFNALQNNVSLFNFNNLTMKLCDTMNCIHYTEFDILFIDPPWGGRDYKKHSVLDLKLGTRFIKDIIVDLKNMGKAGIVLKLPYNFRLSRDYLVGKNLSIYKIYNFYCAIIIL